MKELLLIITAIVLNYGIIDAQYDPSYKLKKAKESVERYKKNIEFLEIEIEKLDEKFKNYPSKPSDTFEITSTKKLLKKPAGSGLNIMKKGSLFVCVSADNKQTYVDIKELEKKSDFTVQYEAYNNLVSEYNAVFPDIHRCEKELVKSRADLQRSKLALPNAQSKVNDLELKLEEYKASVIAEEEAFIAKIKSGEVSAFTTEQRKKYKHIIDPYMSDEQIQSIIDSGLRNISRADMIKLWNKGSKLTNDPFLTKEENIKANTATLIETLGRSHVAFNIDNPSEFYDAYYKKFKISVASGKASKGGIWASMKGIDRSQDSKYGSDNGLAFLIESESDFSLEVAKAREVKSIVVIHEIKSIECYKEGRISSSVNVYLHFKSVHITNKDGSVELIKY